MNPSPQSIDNDKRHNRNCYDYLIQLKPLINPHLLALLPNLNKLQDLEATYHAEFPYGDLYSSVMAYLEQEVERIPDDLNNEHRLALETLTYAIYHNDNRILEQTEWQIYPTDEDQRPKNDISHLISQQLKSKTNPINKTTPQLSGSVANQLVFLVSPNYKPQHSTNIPSLKNFAYKLTTDPFEYRFSTQAQKHNGVTRISPLFKKWLLVKAKKTSDDHPIAHVYFNNLGLDRSLLDLYGSIERAFTLKLHRLEQDQRYKLAVITLPAHKGLLEMSHYKITHDKIPYQTIFNEFLQATLGKGHPSGVVDLSMSAATKKRLFGTEPATQVKALLTASFNDLGFKPKSLLSTAQKQAVWFHFIKYQLTNYIIGTLNPQSYNFSCKDAIDRGAVSSAYFNLIKSFVANRPITREAFEKTIDAAAANVKARGMNFHRKILWNAVDVYVEANANILLNDPQKSWLIYWRDMNCPSSRAALLLQNRLEQVSKQFTSLPDEKTQIKKAGLLILSSVQQQTTHSQQRLLLEIVSRTAQLLDNPSSRLINIYQKRIQELPIKHPYLKILAGLMKAFIGVLLYLPSLGYSRCLITDGLATARSGFFAKQKQVLADQMVDFSTQIEKQPVA